MDKRQEDGPTVRNYIVDFLKEHLDNYLHKSPATADILGKKIVESEKERKAISGVRKGARNCQEGEPQQ